MVKLSKNRIVEYSALIIIISMGTRQSFGIFLPAITEDLGIGREVFSLALAVQNIIFGLPIVGVLADRYGSRWVAIIGGILYGLGALIVASFPSTFTLYTTLGVVMGLALSATSFVVVLGAVAQIVAPERRTVSFGIITAAGSFGMFAVVPLMQWLLDTFGWTIAFYWMAGFVAIISIIATQFPSSPSRTEGKSAAEIIEDKENSLGVMLIKARNNSGYWLLNAGFFVCGFHVAFIATHFPAFLTDNGVATAISGIALSLIGLFNMFGSSLFGYFGDRYRKKYLLSMIYLGRAIVFIIFINFPITATSAIVFGAAIGFLWLATVPLTSGMVVQLFGSRYMSTLYGIVFFSHQIGAFLGSWLGGRIYDSTGNYQLMWYLAIALGVFAFFIHLPITEKPREPQPALSSD